jgi:hypothetical protein
LGEEDSMRKRPKFKRLTVARTVIVLSLTTLAAPQIRSAESVISVTVPCNNPAIVARFVATEFPQDLVILGEAVRGGVCQYVGGRLPVTPVRFVAAVTAWEKAAEPVGYIWAVRLPGGEIAYAYFWKAAHDSMLKQVRGL